MLAEDEIQVAQALKAVARSEQIKAEVLRSTEIYPILLNAARRFVTGETRAEGIKVAQNLVKKGYDVSLEFIGENTNTVTECQVATNEFEALINALSQANIKGTISLDLSHIGLGVNPELALQNLTLLSQKAQMSGLNIMVSMEESAKTDQILGIYQKVVTIYPNVGVTLQAQLNRSADDLAKLLEYPGKVRIVKGAYQEPADIAIGRNQRLDARYLQLVAMLIKAKHAVSIATHDATLIDEMLRRSYLQQAHVEVEMLYGVQPDLCKMLKDKGCPTRIYLTYGTEWYLYLCHRLAEYPPNLYVAVTDCINQALGLAKGERDSY